MDLPISLANTLIHIILATVDAGTNKNSFKRIQYIFKSYKWKIADIKDGFTFRKNSGYKI